MAKKITLESLAQMIERGFEQTSTKEELHAVEHRLDGVEQQLDGVERKIDALDISVHEIKMVLPPLAHTVGRLEVEVIDLQSRVSRLEKKTGLAK